MIANLSHGFANLFDQADQCVVCVSACFFLTAGFIIPTRTDRAGRSAPGSGPNRLYTTHTHTSARTLGCERETGAHPASIRLVCFDRVRAHPARPASPLVSSIGNGKGTQIHAQPRHRRNKRMHQPRTGALFRRFLLARRLE